MNDSNVLSSAIQSDVSAESSPEGPLNRLLSGEELSAAYKWHVENGLGDIWSDEPVPFLDQILVRNLAAPKAVEVSSATDSKTQNDATLSSIAEAGSPIETLYAEIQAFEGCELKETAINTVIADGNPAADIMFIGEAPGAAEDRQGKPFMGDAGELLDKMMAAIDLDRTKVLVTNIVFWRPPGNRKPTNSETEQCLEFTKRHLELIRPKIIVFVGALSAQKLLNTADGITRIRGRWHSYELKDGTVVSCMPILHPAYLLRQPRYKRESWMDLLEVKKKILELGL